MLSTLVFEDNIFLEEAIESGEFLVMWFNNREKAKHIYGAELSVDYIPIHCLKINVNYSYQHLKHNYYVGAQQSPPENKFNVKTYLNLPMGFSSSLCFGFIDKSRWIVVGEDGVYTLYTNKKHSRLDGEIGYSLSENGPELFVAGYNLIQNNNREYPLAEQTKRRITAGLYLTF